jgi:hypothetical protein
MNDFTKEELEMLRKLTFQHVNQFRENSGCIELMRKIRFMIENYCEHNGDLVCNLFGDDVYLCSKCKHVVKIIKKDDK